MTDREYLEKYLPKEKLEKGLFLLKKGLPVQYIVGDVDFYGYTFKVNRNVLIPRFETELLVSKTVDYIKKYFDKVNILDIGTGSGVIAVTLAKKLNAQVTASDISKKALEIASYNAKINEVDIKFIESDLFKNIKGTFDVIVSNPPYIAYDEVLPAKVKNYEPHSALYAPCNGLYFYEEILKEASKYLNKKNMLAFEIGETEGEALKKMAKKYFPDAVIKVEKDFPGKDRYLFIFNF